MVRIWDTEGTEVRSESTAENCGNREIGFNGPRSSLGERWIALSAPTRGLLGKAPLRRIGVRPAIADTGAGREGFENVAGRAFGGSPCGQSAVDAVLEEIDVSIGEKDEASDIFIGADIQAPVTIGLKAAVPSQRRGGRERGGVRAFGEDSDRE